MEEKAYTIGSKKYTQRKLVFGQWEQLLSVLPGIIISGNNKMAVAAMMAKNIPQLFSIVLIPDGTKPEDKDIACIEKEIRWGLDDTTLVKEVITDFFTCNPLQSISANLRELGDAVKAKMHEVVETKTADGSETLSASSPVETSQKKTGSDGIEG